VKPAVDDRKDNESDRVGGLRGVHALWSHQEWNDSMPYTDAAEYAHWTQYVLVLQTLAHMSMQQSMHIEPSMYLSYKH